MEYLEYMDQNFDIRSIEFFDKFNGLKEIENYLDFAISTTIRRQIPDITPQKEKACAIELLNKYIFGADKPVFTRQYNVRNNMNAISYKQIKNLFVKMLVEKTAYDRRVGHKLVATEYKDQCAQYVTEVAASGQLDQISDWINSNITTFIEIYVDERYKKDEFVKNNMESASYENPLTNKAIEKLNLEINMDIVRK